MPWYKRKVTWIIAAVIVLACIGAATDDPAPAPGQTVERFDEDGNRYFETNVEDSVRQIVAEIEAEKARPSCSYRDMHPDDYLALTPGLDAELDAEIEAILAEEERKDTAETVGGGAGSVTIGGNAQVEIHIHKPRKVRQPVTVTSPIMRHEMIIVPGNGQSPVVFMDNAPPRVAVVDAEVARAYAAHMLRLAQTHQP